MRDKFRELLTSAISPLAGSPWQRLHTITPVYAVSKRAADRLIRSGDAHKRCAFADLYTAQCAIPADTFDLLDAEHSRLSTTREQLFESRHKEDDTFINSWRYRHNAKAFHKTVRETVHGCASLATRAPHVTGTAIQYAPPAINLTPASPSMLPTYISCDASASDAGSSFDLHTPTDSEFGHEIHEDKKLIQDCYPVSTGYQSLDYSPSLDVIMELASPTLDHDAGCAAAVSSGLPEIVEEIEEPYTAMEVDSSGPADVPQSPVPDTLDDGDSTPSSSSGAALTAELMTAEIMVGTPLTSGTASHVASPDICVGVDYTQPAEYIDMYLHGYGIDPRDYWHLTSTLSRPLLTHIAAVFANDGLLAGLDALHALQLQLAPPSPPHTPNNTPDYTPDLPAYTPDLAQHITAHTADLTQHTPDYILDLPAHTTAYTADLVSPTDPPASPRAPLAGAVGSRVCGPLAAVLSPPSSSSSSSSSPLSADHADALEDTAGAGEEESDEVDTASVAAAPYGPSRSTTLDDTAVGGAPDGHLGDQLVFMMRGLPAAVGSCVIANTAPGKGAVDGERPQPRLWGLNLAGVDAS